MQDTKLMAYQNEMAREERVQITHHPRRQGKSNLKQIAESIQKRIFVILTASNLRPDHISVTTLGHLKVGYLDAKDADAALTVLLPMIANPSAEQGSFLVTEGKTRMAMTRKGFIIHGVLRRPDVTKP